MRKSTENAGEVIIEDLQEEAKLTAIEKQKVFLAELSEAYLKRLDDEMGKLFNQFTIFISESRLPLVEILAVLVLLTDNIKDNLKKHYLGE